MAFDLSGLIDLFGSGGPDLGNIVSGAGDVIQEAAPVISDFSDLGLGAANLGSDTNNVINTFGGAADVGSANPATFADTITQGSNTAEAAPGPTNMAPEGGPPTGQPGVDNSTISQGPPPTAMAPPNPMVESQRTPGQWWNTTATNAAKQVQDNPWKALGYGGMGVGMLGSAVMAGNQSKPGVGGLPGRGLTPIRSQFPGPQPGQGLGGGQPLPPQGDFASPLLRNQNGVNNGFNVRSSQGLTNG